MGRVISMSSEICFHINYYLLLNRTYLDCGPLKTVTSLVHPSQGLKIKFTMGKCASQE